MTEFSALYFNGRSARRHDVLVRLDADGLAVFGHDGDTLDHWPYDTIELSDHGSGGLRLIKSGSHARLVFSDSGAVNAIRARAPNLTSHNRRVVRNAGIAVALTMAIVVVGYFVLPVLSAAIVPLIPYETEARLGERYVDEVAAFFAPDTDGRRCDSAQGRRALNDLVARLADGGTGPFAYRVEVLDAGEVNAVALPGGHIFVLRGLLDFAERPDEVAGVLAHEMAHVDLRHGMDSLVRGYGVDILANLMFGGSMMGSVSTYMMAASYSRDAEREADEGAAVRLRAAGLSADGMARFFKRLHEKETADGFMVPDFLSTHPPSDVRRDLMRHTTSPSAGRGALSADAWQALQVICEQE